VNVFDKIPSSSQVNSTLALRLHSLSFFSPSSLKFIIGLYLDKPSLTHKSMRSYSAALQTLVFEDLNKKGMYLNSYNKLDFALALFKGFFSAHGLDHSRLLA